MNKKISSERFLSRLAKCGGKWRVDGRLIVHGPEYGPVDIVTDASLVLANVTFLENVEIKGSLAPSIHLESCHFSRNLHIVSSEGSTMLLDNINAASIRISNCKFERACIRSASVTGTLDISGLTLEKGMQLVGGNFRELLLSDSTGDESSSLQSVNTDNLLAAAQFRLAGVPVFMSTKAVREMLRNKSAVLAND